MLNDFTRKRSGGFAGGARVSVDTVGSGASPVVGGSVINTGGTISGLTVHVFLDGVEVGTTTTNSLGVWSYTLSAPANGSHTVTAHVAVGAVAAGLGYTQSGSAGFALHLFDFSDPRNWLPL